MDYADSFFSGVRHWFGKLAACWASRGLERCIYCDVLVYAFCSIPGLVWRSDHFRPMACKPALEVITPMINLEQLVQKMQPRLNSSIYTFCTLQNGQPIPQGTISWFVESEGISVIVPIEIAERAGLTIGFQAEWITLEVNSDLAALGLTAAVSTVLAQAGISCNIVAGYHHDHLFVPAGRGQDAVNLLLELQSRHTAG